MPGTQTPGVRGVTAHVFLYKQFSNHGWLKSITARCSAGFLGTHWPQGMFKMLSNLLCEVSVHNNLHTFTQFSALIALVFFISVLVYLGLCIGPQYKIIQGHVLSITFGIQILKRKKQITTSIFQFHVVGLISPAATLCGGLIEVVCWCWSHVNGTFGSIYLFYFFLPMPLP